METTTIIEIVLASLLGIVVFFLKVLHSDLKETMDKAASNKSKLELLEERSEGKIDQLTITTELQIQNLASHVKTLVDNMGNVQKAIMHLTGNFKSQSELLSDVIDKMK